MSGKYFWSGNIAIAEGALKAGVSFYAGYPITPSSDLMEYMARELPKRGGVFIQGEDELASINMVIGASIAGAKSMTATSGPGYSLMQEALGLAVMLEVPLVVVNVTRLGPSTGQATKSGQGDLMQARWGRHGDQYTVVYTASTPEEAFMTSIRSFNTSEKLRVPVTFLIDELTAHLWETVRIPDNIVVINRRWTDKKETFFDSPEYRRAPPMPILGRGLNVLYTGSTHDGYGYRKTQDAAIHRKLVERLKEKIIGNLEELFRYEIYGEKDHCEVGIITFGSVARSARDAVDVLNARGIKASILNLLTLWPIDYSLLKRFSDKSDVLIVPEMNLGQLIYDVYQVREKENVYPYNKVGGGEPIYPNELVKYATEVLKR